MWSLASPREGKAEISLARASRWRARPLGLPPRLLGLCCFGGFLGSGQDPDWWLNVKVSPLTSDTPPAVGAQLSLSLESPHQGGQVGLHWAPPLTPVFHLLFQTNMKLLP